MNKKEMIGTVAGKCNCTQAQAAEFFEAFAGTIIGELKNNNEVNMPGFGKFIAKHRPAREMRNPATGKMMMSKAKTGMQFKPSASNKDL
ncbi:MAG: HU family DNA-binding protein [Robiginitomaculum sp.]